MLAHAAACSRPIAVDSSAVRRGTRGIYISDGTLCTWALALGDRSLSSSAAKYNPYTPTSIL